MSVTAQSSPERTDAPTLRIAGHDDRRTHKRFVVGRPGKLFRRATQQFAPATTRNLSRSGALLAVTADRPFVVGEIVDLGINFRNSDLVPSESLIRGVVTRVEQADAGRQNVAVRYIQPESLAAAA